MQNILDKRVQEIIDGNYVFAKVLHHFGISFYDYQELFLQELCEKKGIDLKILLRDFQWIIDDYSIEQKVLDRYPLDLIIEYLKHTHYILIKKKITYIADLILNLKESNALANDLKLVFPLFVEDFIEHIYEEEDTLFQLIMDLHKANQHPFNPSNIFFRLRKTSVKDFAIHHLEDEDEMKGLREITHDFKIDSSSTLHMKVILQELGALDNDLQLHASVENDVLFPKAISLEDKTRRRIRAIAKYN